MDDSYLLTTVCGYSPSIGHQRAIVHGPSFTVVSDALAPAPDRLPPLAPAGQQRLNAAARRAPPVAHLQAALLCRLALIAAPHPDPLLPIVLVLKLVELINIVESQIDFWHWCGYPQYGRPHKLDALISLSYRSVVSRNHQCL
jgi:hypothetical protein